MLCHKIRQRFQCARSKEPGFVFFGDFAFFTGGTHFATFRH
ncbi:MAG: hypothetical protein JWN98_1329, partial [Abditibacteriota bacterium]|nr:hypothetical protein [Abditibacteriota bacterium]